MLKVITHDTTMEIPFNLLSNNNFEYKKKNRLKIK